MYEKPFYITDPVSNNAFNYGERANRRLYVPLLVEGGLDDVKPGEEIAFEDFDDEANLKGLRSCKGLRKFVKTSRQGRPVYIFDNHNHAFAFWHLERIRGLLDSGALLVHMDRHKDSRKPSGFLPDGDARDEDAVFRYTNTILNVGNFVPAAVKTGLIGKVINLDGVSAFREFDDSHLEKGNIIFDLDLDIFAPEMDYIGNDLKLDAIGKIAGKSDIITIATSPFFIDQKLALQWLRKIFDFLG